MKSAPIALEVLLDKINLLYRQAAQSPTGLQGLELDLLKKYTRDWYEALLDLERGAVSGEGFPVHRATPARSSWSSASTTPTEATAPVVSSAFLVPVATPAAAPAATPAAAPAAESQSRVQPLAAGGPDSFLYPSRPGAAEGSRKEEAPEIRAGWGYAPHPPRAEPDTPAAAPPPAPPPAAAPAPPAPAAAAPPTAAPAPPEPAAPPTAAPAAARPAVTLPPNAATDEPALNDRFARPERELGQTLAARPAEDLRKLIDVNERFLFTRELFAGNSETYGQAIRRLNELPSLEEALAYVDRELGPANGWNPESKVVLHLRDILERRYR